MRSINKPSILVIEDDKDLLQITTRYLESEGYNAKGATSAEDAYALLAKQAFTLIIVDINLPGDDGIVFCKQLRRSSTAPVVFASARVEDDARALALEGGGDAFLSKPFSLRELLAQVKAIESRTTSKAVTAATTSLSINHDSRQIYKNGNRIELSPKEFELASALMKNPGKALSKSQLIADVWGAFSDVEPQTLTVHMRWLREKLEDDPANPKLFETVRGYGYRFNADELSSDTEVETLA